MYCKELFTWLLTVFLTVAQGLSSAKNIEIATLPKISDVSGSNANNSEASCEAPFHPVGSQCLLIDNRMLGTWSEMRDICQVFGGDLVNMQDANILHDISNYIKDHELTDVSYWVGASDQTSEGIWIWSSDSSPVRMGSPLWGRLYGQEPNGGSTEDCAIISKFDFYYMHDEDCNFQSHGVICQPGASVGSGSLNDSSDDKQPRECPPPYDAVGGKCLLEYYETRVGHDEAVAVCESYGSHLVKIDDANFLGAVYDYLIEKGGHDWYWIDGSDATTEGVWVFSDGTPVKRGTPFWGVFSVDFQAPTSNYDNNYIALYLSYGYLFLDLFSSDLNGVICQFDI